MRRRTPALAGLVYACLILAAAPPAGAARAPAGVTVTIRNFDFSPMEVTARAGASVTWTNLDPEPHTVTSDTGLFRSGALDQGESFTFWFKKRGVYHYLCLIHPKMMGSVTVR